MSLRILLASVTLASLEACAPVTFSNDGAIDFERYRTVLVHPVNGVESDYATDYLSRRLTEISGFSQVTSSAGRSVDLELEVSVTVIEHTTTDDEGDVEIEYESTARFSAYTPSGALVDHGVVTDDSTSYTEAVEDALDEVAHHYLLPFRA